MLRQGDTFKVGLYNSGMDLTNIVLQYSINQTEWLPVSQHTATVSPITDGVYYYRLHNTVTDVYSNIISHSSPYSNNPIALYSSEPIGAGMFRVTAIGAAIIRALITFVGGSTEERTYQNAVPSDWFGEVLQVTCFIDDANGVRRYGINTL